MTNLNAKKTMQNRTVSLISARRLSDGSISLNSTRRMSIESTSFLSSRRLSISSIGAYSIGRSSIGRSKSSLRREHINNQTQLVSVKYKSPLYHALKQKEEDIKNGKYKKGDPDNKYFLTMAKDPSLHYGLKCLFPIYRRVHRENDAAFFEAVKTNEVLRAFNIYIESKKKNIIANYFNKMTRADISRYREFFLVFNNIYETESVFDIPL